MNNLKWLQEFYASLCDGDWEHTCGIELQTIDNPGWRFKFDLEETIWDDVKLNSFSNLSR